MSSDERDAAVLEAIGGDADELAVNGSDANPDSEYVPMEVFREFQTEVFERLRRLENGAGASDSSGDAPPIVHYSNIPEDEREEYLGTSDHIAVTLHDYWEDIAWKLGGGRGIDGEAVDFKIGVDTKTKANAKYNPSRLRHRLKQRLDRDFQTNEIHRGLRALAKLSGGDEHVDSVAARVHITGGLYEYHEKATADGKETRRVLWRVEDD